MKIIVVEKGFFCETLRETFAKLCEKLIIKYFTQSLAKVKTQSFAKKCNLINETCLIIYHLNGNEKASQFIDKYFNQIAISTITYIEILSFEFDDTEIENEVRNFLKNLEL